MDFLVFQYGDIVNFFIKIAKTMPGDAQDCRLRLLVDFYALNMEFHRKTKSNPIEDGKGRNDTLKFVLRNYLDQILDA